VASASGGARTPSWSYWGSQGTIKIGSTPEATPMTLDTLATSKHVDGLLFALVSYCASDFVF
ncbi:hypothetical protein A2U01_0057542, partial [Trifolium medium]|nr:hypothetical protein [Trifolium medium]